MKISLGWINKEGYSDSQVKTFESEEKAFEFCVKHINNIARINGLRIHRDFEDKQDGVKVITEEQILDAIRENEYE